MVKSGEKIGTWAYDYKKGHHSYGDWTFAGNGSGALDSSVKYAGASSYRSIPHTIYSYGTNTLSRNSFSCQQLRVILWARAVVTAAWITVSIRHPSYGDLNIIYTNGTVDWTKFRVSFWYDSASNVRLGRIESWNGSSWIQVGSDTNFGTGSPSADTVVLKVYGTNASTAWFDELEVYAA